MHCFYFQKTMSSIILNEVMKVILLICLILFTHIFEILQKSAKWPFFYMPQLKTYSFSFQCQCQRYHVYLQVAILVSVL